LVHLCDEVHWQLEHVVFPALDAPPAIDWSDVRNR
jgi:hypothetical protein